MNTNDGGADDKNAPAPPSDLVTVALPQTLENALRRYARRSKRFRARWMLVTENGTTAQAARGLFTALVHETLRLINVEERHVENDDHFGFGTFYWYLLCKLDLQNRDRPHEELIEAAVFEFLQQNELVTLKKYDIDMWRSRDGTYGFAGAIGELYLYVFLTEKGKAWAATIQPA